MWMLLALPALAADWTWMDGPVTARIDAEGLGVVQTLAHDTLAAAARTWNIDADAAVTLSAVTEGGAIVITAGTTSGTAPLAVQTTTNGDDLTACTVTLHTSTSGGALAWAVDATAGQQDLEYTLLQALGTCLGLDAGEPPPTGPQDATPTEDQIDALQALYGEAVTDLQEFSHAIRYDFEIEGDGLAGPGEPVLFIVQAINRGDPAYEVTGNLTVNTSDATLTVLEGTWEGGDVPTNEQGRFFFTFQVDDCDPGPNPTTTVVALQDARGEQTDLAISFSVQCAGAGDPDDPDAGCACDNTRGTLPWAVLLFPVIARGRRAARRHDRPRS